MYCIHHLSLIDITDTHAIMHTNRKSLNWKSLVSVVRPDLRSNFASALPSSEFESWDFRFIIEVDDGGEMVSQKTDTTTMNTRTLTPLARAHIRTLATSATATATTTTTASGAAARATFARKLDSGPSFDDFVGGDEIAQGTRVTMGNMKT